MPCFRASARPRRPIRPACGAYAPVECEQTFWDALSWRRKAPCSHKPGASQDWAACRAFVPSVRPRRPIRPVCGAYARVECAQTFRGAPTWLGKARRSHWPGATLDWVACRTFVPIARPRRPIRPVCCAYARVECAQTFRGALSWLGKACCSHWPGASSYSAGFQVLCVSSGPLGKQFRMLLLRQNKSLVVVPCEPSVTRQPSSVFLRQLLGEGNPRESWAVFQALFSCRAPRKSAVDILGRQFLGHRHVLFQRVDLTADDLPQLTEGHGPAEARRKRQ